MIKRFGQLLRAVSESHASRDDSGQGALVIITLVVIAAGVSLSQLSLDNSKRALELELETRANFAKVIAAIELYAIQDTATGNSDFLLPCPADPTAGTGTARSHNGNGCNSSSGDNRGAVPWSTLGLAEADVIDSNGNYLTYIVSSTQTRACDGERPESDVLSDANGGTAGFVLISHGSNGFGGFNSRSNAQVNPSEASTNEAANCATVSGNCTASSVDGFRSGPVSDTEGTTFFDDIVREVSLADTFSTECDTIASNNENLTFIEDDFASGGSNGTNEDITVNVGAGSSSSSESGGDLDVVEDVEIETNGTLFTPDVTPIYVSIDWTPTAASTSTGFSIITRADESTRSAGTSNYTDGVTFNFFSDGIPGNSQTISIYAGGSELTNSGTLLSGFAGENYTLTLGTTYELEVFDNGSRLYARITQVGNINNRAVVYTTDTSDLSTPNQVILLHDDTSGAQSTLDNLVVAKGTVLAEGRNDGPRFAGGSTFETASAIGTSTNFTQELWMQFRDSFPTSTSLIADDSGGGSEQVEFRITWTDPISLRYIETDSTGATVTDTSATGPTLETGTWNHFAFTCESGVDLRFMVNGSTQGSATTDSCDLFQDGATSGYSMSHSGFSSPPNRIAFTEMRLWSTRQDASAITNNYTSRAGGSESNLRIQLSMEDAFQDDIAAPALADSETGAGTANFEIGAGDLVGYRTPFVTEASDICPGNEDATDPFKCVWDGTTGSQTTDTLNIPLDIPEVLVKVWGAGGGGADASGGGGGYATGRVSSVGGTAIAGQSFNIIAGGGGRSGVTEGAGGGGGSAVRFVDSSGPTTTTILIAGGGGGGADDGTFTAGGAGGGSSGGSALGTCGGAGGSQSSGGAAGCDGSAGGAPSLAGAAGGDANNPSGGSNSGGTGFGDGGDGASAFPNDDGGGVGGGYAGGGGGGQDGTNAGGGGGGAGYIDPTDLTSASLSAGSGSTPGNDGDSDRGTAGTGGGTTSNGNPGRVVICWSSSCLP